MKFSTPKKLALCGLCALFASIATAGYAQGNFGHPQGGYGNQGSYGHGPMPRNGFPQGGFHHGPMHHARHAIMRQKAAYARAVAHGDYAAAERAHLRARAIRHHIRARREMFGGGMHGGGGY